MLAMTVANNLFSQDSWEIHLKVDTAYYNIDSTYGFRVFPIEIYEEDDRIVIAQYRETGLVYNLLDIVDVYEDTIGYYIYQCMEMGEELQFTWLVEENQAILEGRSMRIHYK